MTLLVNAVGTAAGLFGIAGMVPQVVKIIREKDASSISLKMYAVTTTAFVLWVIFGILSHSWPVAASNGVMLALVVTILILKLRYG
jgi:MtN3 and saliva related transmembrane protein